MIYLHLAAVNDRNGNPRRLFAVLGDDGRVDAIIEEGYFGNAKVKKHFPTAKEGPRINITVSEYNEWVSWAEERDAYVY